MNKPGSLMRTQVTTTQLSHGVSPDDDISPSPGYKVVSDWHPFQAIPGCARHSALMVWTRLLQRIDEEGATK